LRGVVETRSAAFLLYLAETITESSYVWDLEVPAALDRRDREPDYLVLPFFRNRRPSEVRDSMPPHGPRLAALGGVVAVPHEGISAEETDRFLREKWRETARYSLEALIHGHMRVLAERDRPLHVDLYTRAEGPGNADLVLDWQALFPNGEPASAASWGRIQAALADLSAILPRLGTRVIRVSGNSHLSAAVALGYAFPRTTGFSLEIEQYGAWWSSIGLDVPSPLQVTSQQLEPARKDILLIVAISRPEAVPDATKFITRTGVAHGGRIVAQPRAGPGPTVLVRPDEGRAAVRDIISALTNARARWGSGTTHLFLAAPVALAVLLGHHLNACGPIQVYEHDKTSGRYVRALTLA
jgi:hypothetical protein